MRTVPGVLIAAALLQRARADAGDRITSALALVPDGAVRTYADHTRARARGGRPATGASRPGPGTGSDGDPAVDDRVPVG